MAIEWIDVESSNIEAIGYVEETKGMLVQFKNGSVYRYADVPAKVFEDFKGAGSKGKYLNEHIKGAYAAEKI
ncbi:MAG: KTSC domain-containing protein [Gammaproteobacteria bacterium]|nr:KTSC domain-containing protein [Gammaproteobacteria bacterium]